MYVNTLQIDNIAIVSHYMEMEKKYIYTCILVRGIETLGSRRTNPGNVHYNTVKNVSPCNLYGLHPVVFAPTVV
jgi:hypothetical protein